VVGSSAESPRAAALVAQLLAAGVDATVGNRKAVASADVVCTCTTSVAPVFADNDLRPGAHINAIGAYRLDMCEIPAGSLGRALLVVESVAATLAEAGDVVRAIDSGALAPSGFAYELHELLNGGVGREDEAQITVFKSVGLAVEDLIVARAAADALADVDALAYPTRLAGR
jgi:alanine dehydrogenase